MEIIDSKKKNEVVNKEQKSYDNARFCYVFREKSEDKKLKMKDIVKLRIIVIIQ